MNARGPFDPRELQRRRARARSALMRVQTALSALGRNFPSIAPNSPPRGSGISQYRGALRVAVTSLPRNRAATGPRRIGPRRPAASKIDESVSV